MLHQGNGHPHPGGQYTQVAFTAQGPDLFRFGHITGHPAIDPQAVVVTLSLTTFVEDLITGARDWWSTHENDQQVQVNYARFARLRPDFAPYMNVPVFA